MPTTEKSGAAADNDATRLLMADHREVEALFAQYDKLAEQEGADDEKMLLAAQICVALTIHTQLEEELVYPESRQVLDDQDVVDEAYVEHAGAKTLIAQIKEMSADEPLYDAKVKVLGEYVKHHVKEEETEFFPKLRKTSMDLQALGRRLAQRKKELMAGTGVPAGA
jgi:hemerythrin superfamily protein